MISNDSKQKYLYANMNNVNTDTLIVIKDQDDNVITAFKTGRNIKNLLYSSPDLDYDSYKIYTGGTIDGEETNGLYTKINSYANGEEISYSDASMNMGPSSNNDVSSNILIVLIIEIVLLSILVPIYLIRNKKLKESI